MRLTIVDVFAETRYAGNQLAVVRDAAWLDTPRMQAIALEMNFSETTFVVEQKTGSARVRIFTPDHELPFAGHPTLGTAWVLAEGQPTFALDLAVGRVPVTFADDGVAWMAPPEPTLGDEFPRERAAELLCLTADDVEASWPTRFAEVGPKFLFAPLRSLDALDRARLDGAVQRRFVADGLPVGGTCAFCFARGGHSPDADFAARMFFQVQGSVREDPATGSANACFAAYLRERGIARAIVEQGFEMGRPSRLYLDAGPNLRVGGKVQRVLDGELL